ncbi:MAG: NAD(P)H-hydrate dehydratase, partial [Paracoccaceae bacterium]
MARAPRIITAGAARIDALRKGGAGHKYSHGHALIIAGGPGHGGAARLAARGALRIGAGLVTLGCPPAALAENAAQLNAVMVRGIDGAKGLSEALQDARLNALCIGPGLGAGAKALVKTALAVPAAAPGPRAQAQRSRIGSGTRRAVLLDADALTCFAGDPRQLFDQLHENCVLTPHAGEFARLFPDIAEKLDAPATQGPAYSRADATCEAAARA